MQVAEILSDLTSLRVCEYNDALALITVNQRITQAQPHPDISASEGKSKDEQPQQQKDDLRRAKELVDLHYEIKAKHADGTVDEELSRARENVNRVLRELGH